MKKGCGFLIINVLGLGGLFLLNFSYQTYTRLDQDEQPRYTYFTYATVQEVIQEDVPNEESATDLIPVLTYEFQGEMVTDTAYNLRYMEFDDMPSGDPLGHYYISQEFELAVNEKDKKDYIKWEEVPPTAEDQMPFVIISAIIGGIFTLIWLVGLSRIFKFKEKDPFHRI